LSIASVYSEKELLIRVAQSDEEAFTLLFHNFRGKLYSFILRLSGSPEIAEDAVQDVFLKLWTNRSSLTTVQHFSPYLFRMARNHVLNGLKRVAHESTIISFLSRQENKLTSDPEEKLREKEIREKLQDAVGQLAPQQRLVYTLSRVDGLSQEEIAEKLEISLSTVRNHLMQALKNIRKQLATTYPHSSIYFLVVIGTLFGR